MSKIRKIIDDCEVSRRKREYSSLTNYELLIRFLSAMDILVDAIVGVKDFEEEAMEYCRGLGWKEPE